jgi:hypothetical protein
MLGLFVAREVCHEYDHCSLTGPQPPRAALQKTDLQINTVKINNNNNNNAKIH